jgi:hypothetical protein
MTSTPSSPASPTASLPVATIKRGAQTPWGFAGLLLQWEPGLQDIPPGEHKVYAESQLSALRDQVARLERERLEDKGSADFLRAAFKNFHRSLCARFGYVHDDADWYRDQVSLEEHIALKASQAAPLDVERVMGLADKMAYAWHTYELDQCAETAMLFGDAREALRAAIVSARAATLGVIREVEELLTNVQPKIASNCLPGRAGFIDNYIDPALKKLRAALAAMPAKEMK